MALPYGIETALPYDVETALLFMFFLIANNFGKKNFISIEKVANHVNNEKLLEKKKGNKGHNGPGLLRFQEGKDGEIQKENDNIRGKRTTKRRYYRTI